MKKFLLVFMLLIFAVPLYAYKIELPGENNSINFYGDVRFQVWYQNINQNGKVYSIKDGDDLIYNMQSNSRIGFDLKLGNFFAKLETNFAGDGIDEAKGFGFRQLYGGYNFEKAGRLLIGRTTTVGETGLFYQSLWNINGGLTGYGTLRTNRMPMIQYSIVGLDIQLVGMEPYYTSNYNFDGRTKPGDKWLPLIDMAYNIKTSNATGKIFVSYAGVDLVAVQDSNMTGQRAFINSADIGFGFKIKIADLTIIPTGFYSLNGGLINKVRVATPGGVKYLKQSEFVVDDKGKWQGVNDIHTFGVALAFAYKFTDIVGMEVGGGWQISSSLEFKNSSGRAVDIQTYSAYVSVPIQLLGRHLLFAPTVGYYGAKTQAVAYDDIRDMGTLAAGVYMKMGF